MPNLSLVIYLMVFGVFSKTCLGNDDFCYLHAECDPASERWGGVCHLGTHQSPVDFKITNVRDKPQKVSLDFSYGYKSEDFWIRNNGHTIQVNLEKSGTSQGLMFGYGFNRPYIFAQIHFHWGENDQDGSEHTISGKHFPMEVHLVHYDSKYASFAEAEQSGDPKGLAVLALFLGLGSEEETDETDINEAFDTIASNLPLTYQDELLHLNEPLDLHSFLPQEGATFFRYIGSLTTPNCTEAVEWTVVAEPILVKPSEIRKFHQVLDGQNIPMGLNYRPVQALGDRVLEYLQIGQSEEDTSGGVRSKGKGGKFWIGLLTTLVWISSTSL